VDGGIGLFKRGHENPQPVPGTKISRPTTTALGHAKRTVEADPTEAAIQDRAEVRGGIELIKRGRKKTRPTAMSQMMPHPTEPPQSMNTNTAMHLKARTVETNPVHTPHSTPSAHIPTSQLIDDMPKPAPTPEPVSVPIGHVHINRRAVSYTRPLFTQLKPRAAQPAPTSHPSQ
ncbi:hypothetical protein FRC17_004751, partial [Serendipita sp. 399]